MLRKIDWDSQIGRRMRLRDLHVFSTVVRLGSMAKAAQQLGVSQPSVSEVIADLEHALGVRLLDRKSQGVEPTVYGEALEKRSVAAFDELRQSIRDIEFLANPAKGELHLGCPESISAALLLPIVRRFVRQYPQVVVDLDTVNTLSFAQKLRDRSLDVVLARGGWPLEATELVSDLKVETLFDDPLVIAVGRQSPWARRRKVDLLELRDEPWILTASDVWNYRVIADAFRQRGSEPPNICMKTISVHVRANMLSSGRYIATFPRSVLLFSAETFGLKQLPIELAGAAWPIKMATLRNRTLSPIVERFIDCARTVAESLR
jgi:DNA-binding transcriptional LysR family regulator